MKKISSKDFQALDRKNIISKERQRKLVGGTGDESLGFVFDPFSHSYTSDLSADLSGLPDNIMGMARGGSLTYNSPWGYDGNSGLYDFGYKYGFYYVTVFEIFYYPSGDYLGGYSYPGYGYGHYYFGGQDPWGSDKDPFYEFPDPFYTYHAIGQYGYGYGYLYGANPGGYGSYGMYGLYGGYGMYGGVGYGYPYYLGYGAGSDEGYDASEDFGNDQDPEDEKGQGGDDKNVDASTGSDAGNGGSGGEEDDTKEPYKRPELSEWSAEEHGVGQKYESDCLVACAATFLNFELGTKYDVDGVINLMQSYIDMGADAPFDLGEKYTGKNSINIRALAQDENGGVNGKFTENLMKYLVTEKDPNAWEREYADDKGNYDPWKAVANGHLGFLNIPAMDGGPGHTNIITSAEYKTTIVEGGSEKKCYRAQLFDPKTRQTVEMYVKVKQQKVPVKPGQAQ